MEIQFQLSPADIRDARKTIGMHIYNLRFVTFFFVMGYCLATPLMIRAEATGLHLFIGAVFAFVAVRMAIRISRARRKLPRVQTTLTLDKTGIHTLQNSSKYIDAWSVFQKMIDTPHLLVLRINESPTPIPKRAMTTEQLDAVRTTIEQFTGPNLPNVNSINLFDQMALQPTTSISHFLWRPEDRLAMSRARLRPLSKRSSPEPDPLAVWGRRAVLTLVATMALVAVSTSVLYLVFSQEYNLSNTRSALMVIGSAIPVSLAFAADRWQRFLSKRCLRRTRFPADPVRLCMTDDAIVMGTNTSVASYALVDILGFYSCADFVGFQLYDGFVHAWPSRAFDSEKAGRNFLHQAERNRDAIKHSNSDESAANVSAIPSDNPYQSPKST